MKRTLVWLTLGVSILILYQNCGPGFMPLQVTEGLSRGVVIPGGFLGENPNLISDCMTNPAYNSCLFYKNPVAQTGQIYNPPINFGMDLSGDQIHAVNIRGLDNSGYLSNANLQIAYVQFQDQNGNAINQPGFSSRVRVNSAGNWKYTYSNDSAHSVAQLMAFYWLNSEISGMKAGSGVFYTEGKQILVDPYSLISVGQNNAFFMPPTGAGGTGDSPPLIIMGRVCLSSPGRIDPNCSNSSKVHEAAISAEVYTHEMGHGNFFFADKNRSLTCIQYDSSSNTYLSSDNCPEQICPEKNDNSKPTPRCCKDPNGCIGAFNEGQADFHSALMFPSNPKLGETFIDGLSGLTSGGRLRDVTANRNALSFTVFSNPDQTENPFKGEIHALGTVYAAAWWNFYNSAPSKTDVQQIFADHLLTVQPSDNFPVILSRILSIDDAQFGGRNRNFIIQAFYAVGISPSN